MAQAPVLEGTTLASVKAEDGFKEVPTIRGATAEMADGSVRFELVASGVKREFTLAWDMLTSTQKANIITAFTALLTGYTSSNFTDVNGVTYTVTRYPGQYPEFTPVVAAGGLRYKAELKLREV